MDEQKKPQSMQELMAQFFALRQEHGLAEQALSGLKTKLDETGSQLIELMEESGLTQLKDTEGRTVFLSKPNVYATVKGEKYAEAIDFLKNTWKVGDEIREQIAPATLSRILKEKLEQGETVPEQLFSYYMKRKLGSRK